MTLSTVTWRQVVAALAATAVGLLAMFVVLRADGLAATDAASARATGWFVHQPSGRTVLVDGYRGRALGSIDTETQSDGLAVAEGALGAYLLDDATGEARSIDTAAMRLGTPFGLASLGDGEAIAAVGQSGLVVVNPVNNEATVAPVDGDALSFDVDTGSAVAVGRNGAVWSIVGSALVRTTSNGPTAIELGIDEALLSVVGSEPLVVDPAGRRARFGTGGWQALPTDAPPSEIVAQVPGPAHTCGWVATGDDLWCVGTDGIDERSTIDGLDVAGGDLLAIAGDAGAVVHQGPSEIVHIDWRRGEIFERQTEPVPADAELQMTATVDLVWIDDLAGDTVWAVNPWNILAIDKDPVGLLVLDADGDVVDDAEAVPSDGGGDRSPTEPDERVPDDNGIDDPPVAVDDSVLARSRSSVSIDVTANDYDPDGDAVVVASVGTPGHGTVDIGSASTVVYTPEPGYVGLDDFEYTIVDAGGASDTASVAIELVGSDALNESPIGVPDAAETGAGVPVVIDVLLNDIDPERDPLQLDSFSPPEDLGGDPIGELTEARGPSDLPALNFVPAPGFEGTAIFSYRPVDALGAVGDDVEVRVEVADRDAPNRPPVVRPDAVRLRREFATPLPVLANDVDPDNDQLALSVVEPLPAGLDVEIEGDALQVTARAGAGELERFEYEVDDLQGHTVRGSVLVAVIDDLEPNRPPLVTADSFKVVGGETVVVDVTANDHDEDGDPLTVVDVSAAEDESGRAVVFSRGEIQFTANELPDGEDKTTDRFTYTVSDGNGHEVSGDVSVTVLPEAVEDPPFARDDSTFTYVNVPVTIDVLRNDVDPSGGRLSLAGRPSCPAGGAATITTEGQIRFDPPSSPGAYRCTYEVVNTAGEGAAASIIVSVRPAPLKNRPPTVVDDVLTVEIGTSRSIDVTANDRALDAAAGRPLTVVSSTAPVVGTAQRSGNVITYNAGNVPDNATISYQVVDAEGGTAQGFLLVRITERRNEPPIATPDAQTVFAPAGPTSFSVLANDTDPDETPGGLRVTAVSMATGPGSATFDGSLVTLTPPPDFIGQMSARYTIADGAGASASSTVTLNVETPPNRAPDARDDSADVANGGTVTVPVLLNDTDLDDDALTVSIVSGPDPSLGSASVVGNGAITFVAQPGAAGIAVIRYQLSDGELDDTATLAINVRACTESTPIANSTRLLTGYMTPVLVDLAGLVANGTIVDLRGPVGYDPASGIYTPPAGENGDVEVTYTVANGCRLRANGRVTIDVNQSPVASGVAAEVGRLSIREIPVSQLASDAEALRIERADGAPAWVTVQGDRLIVTPLLSLTDRADFTVRVVDPGGLFVDVPVTIFVRPQPPTATPDAIDVSDGAPRDVGFGVLLANDSGPGIAVTSVTTGALAFSGGGSGNVSVSGDVLTIDPGSGRGTATFSYTIRNLGGEATATVTVTGPAVPPPTTTEPPPPPSSAPPTSSTTLPPGP